MAFGMNESNLRGHSRLSRDQLTTLAHNWPALSEQYLGYARMILHRKPFQLWECYALASLARAHYTVESVFRLVDREADCASLARILYEHVVAFAWLMVDPALHYQRLLCWENVERTKMVKGLAKHTADAPTEAEATMYLLAAGLDLSEKVAPETFDRAALATKFWDSRVASWKFGFERSYANLYRPYSAYVHPTVAGLQCFFDADIERDPATPQEMHAGSVPVEAMMLFVDALRITAETFGWPSERELIETAFKGFEIDEEQSDA